MARSATRSAWTTASPRARSTAPLRHRPNWLGAILGLVVVFLAALAITQVPHTTWLRGSVWAVEEDVLSALWPLAQSLDSPMGYGYTGDNPYPHLIQGSYGGTAFYPPGYPVLLWLSEKLVGDPHRATQLISGGAAAILLAGTYWLGLGWTGKRTIALLAATLVTTSSVFLTLAYATSTDLLAGAGATVALASGVWALRHPTRRRWIIWAALAVGLAFLVRRQTAVVVVPLLALAAASAWGRWREAGLRVGLLAGIAGIVALPDMLIQLQLHGSPFHSAHGKNIWNAVINDYDWPAWHDVPNTVSPIGVASNAPAAILENWLGNLLHYSETLWLGPATFLVLPGLVLLWRRSPLRGRTVAAMAAASFVVVVASLSERGDRHALILVPTLAVVAAAGVWYGAGARWRVRIAVLTVGLGLAVSVAHTVQLVRDELQVPHLQPVVAALEADGAGAEDVLTSFGAAHYAYYANVGFEPLDGDVITWRDLRSFMEAHGAEYFVARRRELHEDRLPQSLEPSAAPDWLTPLWEAPPGGEATRIVLYRFDPHESD